MSQPAYLIGQFSVKEFPQYRDQNGRPVVAQFAKIVAELLTTPPCAETLEGEWSSNQTVIIDLPSWESAIE